jgi:hypothetical protein
MANLLDQGQQGSAIVGERILDRSRDRTFRLSVHNPFTSQLAELLGENLLLIAQFERCTLPPETFTSVVTEPIWDASPHPRMHR